jgi:UDP-N-acetylglucosamine--dolichyl-phosphate N-acetylglucosaminephosphotransferase
MVTIPTVVNIAVSFFATLIGVKYWISRANQHGLVGKDMHKHDGREVAEHGGIGVVFGFLMGILTYIALQVFYYHNQRPLLFLMAAATSVSIACIIGLVDGLLGWKIGLRQYQKAVLTILIALPIMVVNAGDHIMNVPFIGNVDFGLLYPLLLVPIGIIGASNAFNMLAGFNGLEAGMGIIITGTLGYIAWQSNITYVALIAACMCVSLIAFFFFNKPPAKVFPGDTMTYSVGATIAIIAILGNLEKFALILFIPYLFEFILKARGRMHKESFGKLMPDGSLENRYPKWYGLTHVAISFLRRIKGTAYESEVVLVILGSELLLAALAVLYFVYV